MVPVSAPSQPKLDEDFVDETSRQWRGQRGCEEDHQWRARIFAREPREEDPESRLQGAVSRILPLLNAEAGEFKDLSKVVTSHFYSPLSSTCSLSFFSSAITSVSSTSSSSSAFSDSSLSLWFKKRLGVAL
jgi:hypothetical protein